MGSRTRPLDGDDLGAAQAVELVHDAAHVAVADHEVAGEGKGFAGGEAAGRLGVEDAGEGGGEEGHEDVGVADLDVAVDVLVGVDQRGGVALGGAAGAALALLREVGRVAGHEEAVGDAVVAGGDHARRDQPRQRRERQPRAVGVALVQREAHVVAKARREGLVARPEEQDVPQRDVDPPEIPSSVCKRKLALSEGIGSGASVMLTIVVFTTTWRSPGESS
jgi:hypothetical protein